ncbi:MAG: hypothetical protein ACKVX9_16710 [Blastocatellia bacterium]
MKRILLSLFAVMLLILATPAAAQKKKGEKESSPPPAKTRKAPEGAIIQGDNKATLKSGYTFDKQSNNSVAVRRANNNITGSFSCTCQGQGAGTCSVSIEKEVLVCIGTCADCRFSVVINPVKAMKAGKAEGKKSKN